MGVRLGLLRESLLHDVLRCREADHELGHKVRQNPNHGQGSLLAGDRVSHLDGDWFVFASHEGHEPTVTNADPDRHDEIVQVYRISTATLTSTANRARQSSENPT